MLKPIYQVKPYRYPVITVLFVFLLIAAGCSTSLTSDNAGTVTQNLVQQVPVSSEPQQVDQAPIVISSIDEVALADLYECIVPAVVNIQVMGSSMASGLNPEDFPFDLPEMPDIPQGGEGSGWLFDDQGHVITNNHVVENAEQVLVIFHDGLWAEAEVVATDPQSDLAVLKVDVPEESGAFPLPLAEPDSLRVGYGVIAIGNPFGLESTMTTGIVSALGRSFPTGNSLTGSYTLPAVIQTDAAINPGNSGGPLLNLDGEVVGVNFAIESPVRANAGIGFAIPVSIVERVVPALIDEGVYHYPYLGISGQSVTPQLAEALDLPEAILGTYVGSVPEDGPAANAGVIGGSRALEDSNIPIRAGGDIIVAIDEAPVRSFEDLVSYLVRKTEPGQNVSLTVLRDGELIDLNVELGERPQPVAQQMVEPGEEGISSREAITIARKTVADENLLEGDVVETVVVESSEDGQSLWVVTLSDGDQTAHVIIDKLTGEVLRFFVER